MTKEAQPRKLVDDSSVTSKLGHHWAIVVALAALLAAGLAAALYFSIHSIAVKEDARKEFAQVLLQGGVLGALGVGIKKMLDDWEQAKNEEKARAEQQQRYCVKILFIFRRRFRDALDYAQRAFSPVEGDAEVAPTAWFEALTESVEGNSSDLLERFRLFRRDSTFYDQLREVFTKAEKLRDASKESKQGTLKPEIWGSVLSTLQRGHELVGEEIFVVTDFKRNVSLQLNPKK